MTEADGAALRLDREVLLGGKLMCDGGTVTFKGEEVDLVVVWSVMS